MDLDDFDTADFAPVSVGTRYQFWSMIHSHLQRQVPLAYETKQAEPFAPAEHVVHKFERTFMVNILRNRQWHHRSLGSYAFDAARQIQVQTTVNTVDAFVIKRVAHQLQTLNNLSEACLGASLASTGLALTGSSQSLQDPSPANLWTPGSKLSSFVVL